MNNIYLHHILRFPNFSNLFSPFLGFYSQLEIQFVLKLKPPQCTTFGGSNWIPFKCPKNTDTH